MNRQEIFSEHKEVWIQNGLIQSLKTLTLFDQPRYWDLILKDRDWTRLKQLSLTKCQLTNSTFQNVMKHLDWPKLVKLDLSTGRVYLVCNELEGDVFQFLLIYKWGALNELWLSGNKLKFIAIPKQINSQQHSLSRLKRLYFCRNPLGKTGIKSLTKLHFPVLQHLSVKQCNLNNEGALLLTKGNWPKLIYLNIGQNHINFDSFSKLYYLNLNPRCVVSIEGNDKTDVINVGIAYSAINCNINFKAKKKIYQQLRYWLHYRRSQ